MPIFFMLNRQMQKAVFVRRLSKSVSAERGMLSHKKEKKWLQLQMLQTYGV